MASRIRVVDEARRTWFRRRVELGAELRAQRLMLGATQRTVGAAIGVSRAEVSRRERGVAPYLPAASLFEHAAAVGLRVSVTTHPTGVALRDAGQVRYLDRFLERIGTAPWRRELEAVIPLPGDLRAVDLVLRAPGVLVAVEVMTRLADLQAQLRVARLKARDIGASRLIIVVAATHANRRTLGVVRTALLGAWELDSRRVLAALASGRVPDRDAIVLL